MPLERTNQKPGWDGHGPNPLPASPSCGHTVDGKRQRPVTGRLQFCPREVGSSLEKALWSTLSSTPGMHTRTHTRTRRRTLTCVSERGVTSGPPPLSKRNSVSVSVFLSQNFMTVQNHRLSELERVPEMILFKSFLCKN